MLEKDRTGHASQYGSCGYPTHVEIFKLRETLKLSSLDLHIVTSSEYTKRRLDIVKTPITYCEEPVCDQLKITTPPEGCESWKFGATSLSCFDSDL